MSAFHSLRSLLLPPSRGCVRTHPRLLAPSVPAASLGGALGFVACISLPSGFKASGQANAVPTNRMCWSIERGKHMLLFCGSSSLAPLSLPPIIRGLSPPNTPTITSLSACLDLIDLTWFGLIYLDCLIWLDLFGLLDLTWLGLIYLDCLIWLD